MPAQTIEEMMESIKYFLAIGGSKSESEITRRVFYDEKMGAQTARTRDIYKALDRLEHDKVIIKKRKKDSKGERWVYEYNDLPGK